MLGVESVCGQWAEWLTSVPLIVYMTIAVEDKKSLALGDFIVIGSCFLCVFCGFLLTLSQNSSRVGMGLLLLSFFSVCVTVIFLSFSTGTSVAREQYFSNPLRVLFTYIEINHLKRVIMLLNGVCFWLDKTKRKERLRSALFSIANSAVIYFSILMIHLISILHRLNLIVH